MDSETPNASQLQKEWSHLLNQSVSRIQHCVGQLSHDQLWWKPAVELNSIGALIRHLCGNLNQWVVDGVPQTQNSRNRTAEFESGEQETAAELLNRLRQVVDAANGVLDDLHDADFGQPRCIQGFDVTALGAVMHSVPHFVGHTHQIVLLTRLQLGADYQFHWDSDAERGEVPL